jgi:PAS domain S-box-containing protein
MRIVDHVCGVERQEADGEFRRVEPDASADEPRHREEDERGAPDQHELRDGTAAIASIHRADEGTRTAAELAWRAQARDVAARSGQVAKVLREQKERVLELWEERARRTIASAKRPDRLMLLDGLPDLIEEVAGALEASSETSPPKVAESSESATGHGRQRATNTDYSIEQVIAEYDLLRQVVLETLDREAPGALTRDDRDAIAAFIHMHVRSAAAEFTRVREAERERARQELERANQSLESRVAERTKQLALSEARFRGLVEGVKDYAIFTVNQRGFVTSWNAGAQRMKGYTTEEILGVHFSILYTAEGKLRDDAMGHLRAAVIEGRFRGEGIRVRKNGDVFLADVLITPMYDGDELSGFSKVVQDLTERNLLLQERDLLRSDADRLRIEGEYRQRFITTLSHDLRSPLSAAKAGAQLIARSPDRPEKTREWALRISHAVDRADRMIIDLLDASRIDAGQPFKVEVAECDLRHIAEDVCADVATRYGDRFTVESRGDTVGVWGADALWRVLENLLTNAVKYGEPGTTIHIKLERRDSRMVITVHNVGTIIPVSDQAKLFQPYHRTDVAEASGKRGWGLGLTLVRGIVEAHKGQVKVESYPKEGTTFTVDLPVDAREPTHQV